MKLPSKKFLYSIFAFLLILFGLWVSLHYTFYLIGADSDNSFGAMIYTGIQNYGLKFIKYLHYTIDNWLLSLTSIYFILFSIFGVNQYIIVLVGWLIFVVSAFASGYIVYKLTKNISIAFVCIFLSLFLGIFNATTVWFVYPYTHNISVLWLLISLVIVINIFSKPIDKKNITHELPLFLILFFVTFIAGFSDPWFNAAFNLAIILSFIAIHFTKNKHIINKQSDLVEQIALKDVTTEKNSYRINTKLVILTVCLALFFIYTKLFGILGFVQSSHYSFLSSFTQLKDNLYYYGFSILTFFNIFQAFKINILFGVFFTLLTFYVVFIILKQFVNLFHDLSLSYAQKITVYFAILSIITISLAFLLSNFPQGFYSARFIMNIFYLIIILFGIFAFLIKPSKKLKNIILVYTTFFILIGISFKPQIWINSKLVTNNLGIENLINTLKENNLHFGYGDYWTTQVNSINVFTHGKITVIGITDNFTPHMQTNTLYFRTNTIPKENYYFVVFPNQKTFEWKKSLPESIKEAELYFGKPIKIIPTKNHTILVWDHVLNFNEIAYKIFSTLFNSAYVYLQNNSLSNLYPQYLEEHGYLYKFFGYKTGSVINRTQNNGWIGQRSCPDGKGKCFGVGISGNIDTLKPIIEKYKPQALQIFFPYPKVYKEDSKETKGQLLMIFRAPM